MILLLGERLLDFEEERFFIVLLGERLLDLEEERFLIVLLGERLLLLDLEEERLLEVEDERVRDLPLDTDMERPLGIFYILYFLVTFFYQNEKKNESLIYLNKMNLKKKEEIYINELKMKTVYFNQKGFEIQEKELRHEVYQSIKRIGHYNVTSKYYNFLNKKNLSEIKDGEFRVSLSSFGKKYILFLIKIHDKRYSILINKKNEIMVTCQYKFHQSLYDGTLLDGELVKNENNKWIFIINDIPYYKGENLITKSFDDRQNIIVELLKNEYRREEQNNHMTYICQKIYVKYEYLEDLSKRLRDSLSYKCSGLYFKNIFNYSDNYLYIFPECRTDHQILNKPVEEVTSETVVHTSSEEIKRVEEVVEEVKKKNYIEDDIFGDLEVVKTNEEEKSLEKEKKRPARKYCKFLIKPTSKPEVFELYCRAVDRHIEKYSYAAIPDMKTSKFLKDLFISYTPMDDITSLINEKKAIYVECLYNKNFKRWIPYKKCDDMDHHTFINEIAIIMNTYSSDSESENDD